MRKFNWSNFNEDFLRKVILDQTIDPKEKARIEARTDKDSLAGEMLRLFQFPDDEATRLTNPIKSRLLRR